MITKEIQGDFIITKSDTYLIRKITPTIEGREEIYVEAVDLIGSGFEYEETDEPLAKEESEEEVHQNKIENVESIEE